MFEFSLTESIRYEGLTYWKAFEHSVAIQPMSVLFCTIGMGKHVLLLLLTFGIWKLVWVYRTTDNLNCIEGEDYRSPAAKLLLCMFVPFYSIYWTYKSAEKIDKLARMRGISSNLSVLCPILEVFIGVIAPILMQNKINEISTTGYHI